ncbi:cytochrome c oxidase subunit 5b-1, mitochondrial-like [Nymphaea colorata]|nr:cytochrome c oxidase subunit 5b-1, mitochondrial-like [Nymphaea colorata]
MWRRIAASLHTLTVSAALAGRSKDGALIRRAAAAAASSSSLFSPASRSTPRFLSQQATSDAETILSKGKKRVEDVMPIATGHEREELEAELEGGKRFDMDAPTGPFGTKEAPAIVQSYYDKRLVGCPGGEGEDEHDVVWFWLEKDKPFECPVCSQYFQLEVIGEGGPPDGHGDDDH